MGMQLSAQSLPEPPEACGSKGFHFIQPPVSRQSCFQANGTGPNWGGGAAEQARALAVPWSLPGLPKQMGYYCPHSSDGDTEAQGHKQTHRDHAAGVAEGTGTQSPGRQLCPSSSHRGLNRAARAPPPWQPSPSRRLAQGPLEVPLCPRKREAFARGEGPG